MAIEGDELKRCPFCGGKASEHMDSDGFWSVRCGRCDVGQTNPYVEMMHAVEAWNERTPEPASIGPLSWVDGDA
jgi:ribosomal protein S27AE